jgi:hypothetical protein
MSEYLSPQQAVEHYGLKVDQDANESEIERVLRESGIAAIEIPLSPDDFKRFSEGFAVALGECPGMLRETSHTFDSRYGSEAGYTKKETKFNESGIQIADPKNYFHFTESVRDRWREQFARGPKVMRDFLEDGFEIHDALLSVAKQTTVELENTHPGISKLHFPNNNSFSVLRLLRYGGYKPQERMLDVATPHNDIGSETYQAYADAPGFWAAPGGENGTRTRHDTAPNEAYLFLGEGHEKVYGEDDELKPLYHGVDRVIPAGVTWVPERTAVILFVNAPEVDYGVDMTDTRPYTAKRIGNVALA